MRSIATSPHFPVVRPMRRDARALVGDMLAMADIRINGPRPWDIRVHHPEFFQRVIGHGSLGLGESYMDGDWDAEQLDGFFHRVFLARLDQSVKSLRLLVPWLMARLTNRQSRRRAWRVGKTHYDLGNDFMRAMIGPCMTYSCGYWRNAGTLEQAQHAKLDLVCRKLQLKPGMRLLDVGCGWGALMAHASARHGAHCTGITISREQADYIRNNHQDPRIEVELIDYRGLDGTYDRIASVGMFEHVGRKNHRDFMRVIHRCLADDGIFLLHTIGRNQRGGITDPWIDKYIFPNGELPALDDITSAADGLFVTEDVHNIGADYDKTLMAWHRNFEAAWPSHADQMGDRFHRMWRYYLLSCAGAFRARAIQVWQWTLTKHGMPGGCRRVV
jgi:cyclopropane-fatty-acyl-phospholipid synthase